MAEDLSPAIEVRCEPFGYTTAGTDVKDGTAVIYGRVNAIDICVIESVKCPVDAGALLTAHIDTVCDGTT